MPIVSIIHCDKISTLKTTVKYKNNMKDFNCFEILQIAIYVKSKYDLFIRK